MRRVALRKTLVCIFSVLFLNVFFIPPAQAEIYYNIAIKGVSESNVVGLLSDKRGGYAGGTAGTGGTMMGAMGMGGSGSGMGSGSMGPVYTGSGSTSDTAIDLFANLGAAESVAQSTSLFVTGSAERMTYHTFTQLNATMGGLSAGVIRAFGDAVTAKFSLNGSIKRFGDSERDATAYGMSFEVKETLTQSFWLKEGYVYEKDNAQSAFFSYNADAAGISGGYLILPNTTALLGYNYLVRDYDQPSGFKVTAQTESVGLEYEFLKKWFLTGQYDHQVSDSNAPDTRATDNIFSLGVRYSY